MKVLRIHFKWPTWGVRLRDRDKRAVRLAAWFLVPALLYGYGVRPAVHTWVAAHEKLETERGLLGRERLLLHEAANYPGQFHHQEQALIQEAPRLFGGPDAVSATAVLADYVSAAAYANRVFIQGSETRPAESVSEGLQRIAIEIRAVGDLEGIEGLLRTFEQGQKLVQVRRLAVLPAQRINTEGGSDEEVLGFSALISGYMLSGADEKVEKSQ